MKCGRRIINKAIFKKENYFELKSSRYLEVEIKQRKINR